MTLEALKQEGEPSHTAHRYMGEALSLVMLEKVWDIFGPQALNTTASPSFFSEMK